MARCSTVTFFTAIVSLFSVAATSTELTPIISGSTTNSTATNHVALSYGSPNSSSPSIQATVNASMKLPAVLLEEISSVSSVVCSSTSVTITFSNQTAWNKAYAKWPSSNFIFFTNHLGNCDAENDRGLYLVSSLAFTNSSLTVTASSSRVVLGDYSDSATITFSSSSSSNKRDISATVSADLSGTILDTKDLDINAEKASFSATLDFSGGLSYNFSTWTLQELYVDFDLNAAADLEIAVNASASYSTNLYSYTPAQLSVSAFTIAGILSVGPYLKFSAGVEFAASGNVDAVAEATFNLADGNIHLDLLNAANTKASNWTPTYTADANISVEAEVQLNPYVEVTAGFGIDIFNGLIDVSAGLEAKPEIVNAFWVDGAFNFDSVTGVSIAEGSGTCPNGFWFESVFDFEINAFVTNFYTVTLYSVELPIYQTNCIAW